MAEILELIEDIEQLSYENQEVLVDIINKRFAERKREKFIEETIASENELLNGDFTEGNSDELFKALNI